MDLNDSWIWFAAVCTVALCAGSFVTVVVHRLPQILQRQWRMESGESGASATHDGLSLWWPPSHCPQCKKRLKWRHNIPLLSFIVLRGRCAYCSAPLKAYFAIELTTLVTWLAVFHTYGITPQFATAALACTLLVALACIDRREKILPDEITLLMLWTGLLANAFSLFATPADAIFGAAAGYSVFFLIKHLFSMISGKQGLGQGDLKLLAAIGAWLGWQALPGIVLVASLSGILIHLVLTAAKRRAREAEIAFGPYLAFACFIGLVFADVIKNPFAFAAFTIGAD